jgi:hypothetical protein
LSGPQMAADNGRSKPIVQLDVHRPRGIIIKRDWREKPGTNVFHPEGENGYVDSPRNPVFVEPVWVGRGWSFSSSSSVRSQGVCHTRDVGGIDWRNKEIPLCRQSSSKARWAINRPRTRMKRITSTFNPLRGCNSQQAQYYNTPPPQPHLSSTSTSTRTMRMKPPPTNLETHLRPGRLRD